VVPTAASRADFSAYACILSRSIGHAPTAACQMRWASDGSGSGLIRTQRRTTSVQSPGSSESTASRARTSSLRLVSWVDSVVMDSGHRRCRSSAESWNVSGLTPKSDGSLPTSLRAVNRVHR
jgi:hypothetical protein